MHGEILAKCGHPFGEIATYDGSQMRSPFAQNGLRRFVQSRNLGGSEFLRMRDWREFGAMQDFVRIRIADARIQAWIGAVRHPLLPAPPARTHVVVAHRHNQTLEIEFNSGSVYDYAGVPQGEYDGFMGADSKGKYFHANIKNRYSFVKL